VRERQKCRVREAVRGVRDREWESETGSGRE